MTWEYRSTDMKSTTSTVPGSQTRPRSLRPEVDQHQVLGALLGVGEQFVGQRLVLLRGGAARPGARDRVHHRSPVLDLDQRLGARPDDVEAVEAEQVHVRARVGGPQHPVDVERARRAAASRSAGEGTTWKASPALIRSLMSSTAAWKSSPPHSAVYSRQFGRAAARRVRSDAAATRSAAIASRRATASAYASSTPVSRSLWLIALAISRTEPSQWSRTARSEVSSMVSSGSRRSSRVPGPIFSSRRTMSYPR